MQNSEIVQNKLQPALEECRLHQQRLLPAMLQLTQEWVDNEAFIDKLNRAEKIGLIPSTEQWQMLREYRNQTAHEYPSRPELVIANLKQLVASVPLLESILSQLQHQAQQRVSTF